MSVKIRVRYHNSDMTYLRLPDPGINRLFFISKNIVSSSACSFQDNLSPSTKLGVSVMRSHFSRRTKHEKRIAMHRLKYQVKCRKFLVRIKNTASMKKFNPCS